MLDYNLLVGTSTSEVYGLYEHLPWIRLFKLKVFTYLKIIT